MYRSCAKCGRMHPSGQRCTVGRVYINTDERRLRSQYSWTKKSQEIRERANYLCEVCRDKGIITYENIEVHHITKVKDDKSLLLDNDNLIALCTEHHKLADENKIDKDYLLSLAKKRETEIDTFSETAYQSHI